MTKRARILVFTPCAVAVVAGAVCGALVGGTTGELLAFVLIGLGLVAATSLVFLEVGLSEDRERERRRRLAQARGESRRRLTPSPLGRARDHRRRLR
jgi:hypothetical protein